MAFEKEAFGEWIDASEICYQALTIARQSSAN